MQKFCLINLLIYLSCLIVSSYSFILDPKFHQKVQIKSTFVFPPPISSGILSTNIIYVHENNDIILSNYNKNNKNEEAMVGGDILIERISSRSRVLDLRVFRGFSMSSSEFVRKQYNENNILISNDESILQLTSSYNDNGTDISVIGKSPVQFVAVVNTGNAKELEVNHHVHSRTNGVIASIDAQIKLNDDNYHKDSNINDIPITNDYVSLKNLNVHEDFRRRGIASALVKMVKMYAKENKINTVMLEVEYSNKNAIRLYQREGFQFMEKMEGIGGTMVYIDQNS